MMIVANRFLTKNEKVYISFHLMELIKTRRGQSRPFRVCQAIIICLKQARGNHQVPHVMGLKFIWN